LIKKAVVPVAGLGTRFLPATKSIPKEMLPIVDRPLILYIVEEAVEAGIEHIVFVTGRHKNPLEDFFDHNYELEDTLERQGKKELLKIARSISEMVSVASIRQKNPKGLGHAVLAARPVVGEEPFAVLLGDEIMHGKPNVMSQLVKAFEKTEKSVVAIMKVPPEDSVKYGMVKVKKSSDKNLFAIEDVVEKPKPEKAPSQFALPGRYIFTAQIFDELEKTKPSVNGEIQLTDAMTTLAKKEGLWGLEFEANRYDAGDKFGFLRANIEFGLRHPEVKAELKKYIRDLAKTL
jgi:UTP--glucose-1-phosphate uridylyltransferase